MAPSRLQGVSSAQEQPRTKHCDKRAEQDKPPNFVALRDQDWQVRPADDELDDEIDKKQNKPLLALPNGFLIHDSELIIPRHLRLAMISEAASPSCWSITVLFLALTTISASVRLWANMSLKFVVTNSAISGETF